VNLPENLSSPALVLFQHNVEAMIWKRHYEVQPNALKKAYLKNQWLKTLDYERKVSDRFDLVIAVSKEDADTFRKDYGIENVIDVPTGVDIDYFRPQRDGRVKPNSLVFTGSMDWLPNEDAMQYFTKEILPLVRKRIPDVVITIVGRNPYPSLLESSQRDRGVIVTGRVDDVRPYLDSSAVFVVPLRIGGGTRLKIYEAMAMELPVVSTTIGAEGLPVVPGKEIVMADTPEGFAESVTELLNNREMAQELGRNAATRVRNEFGWDQVAKTFATACENVLRG
jgi:glycosyltransferase involved in cell wall biosynthesis